MHNSVNDMSLNSFLATCCPSSYLSVVNLERVKLIGVFCEVAWGPGIPCLFLIHAAEIIHSRVLIIKLVQFVSPNGGADSTPWPEHPVSEKAKNMLKKSGNWCSCWYKIIKRYFPYNKCTLQKARIDEPTFIVPQIHTFIREMPYGKYA